MKSFEEAFTFDNLMLIYQQLKASKTDRLNGQVKLLTGWDRIGYERFELEHVKHLSALSRKALTGRYLFRPSRRIDIPKPGGGTRPICYPSIRDSIAQRALYEVVGPAIESRLTDAAFAYRKGRSTHDAVATVYEAAIAGFPWVFETDFSKFFDSLVHDRLLGMVEALDLHPKAKTMVRRFIKTGEVLGSEKNPDFPASRTVGVPQGGVLSGALANLYLADFDRQMESADWRLIRYADDFVVMCKDEAALVQAEKRARELACELDLKLHPDKTHKKPIDKGIDFVGFRIKGTKISVRASNVEKFKGRIRAIIREVSDRIENGESSVGPRTLNHLIGRINWKIEGVFDEEAEVDRSWVAYFRIINDVEQLRELDRWVRIQINGWTRRYLKRSFNREALTQRGLQHLTTNYWRVRRHQATHRLHRQGFVLKATTRPATTSSSGNA